MEEIDIQEETNVQIEEANTHSRKEFINECGKIIALSAVASFSIIGASKALAQDGGNSCSIALNEKGIACDEWIVVSGDNDGDGDIDDDDNDEEDDDDDDDYDGPGLCVWWGDGCCLWSVNET